MSHVGIVLALLPAVATARSPDLAPDSAEWNGLSRFVGGLRGGGLDLRTPDRIDLATLPPGAGLALIGVPDLGDATALERFVAAGGRLLVAAEGPAVDPLLARLGITRIASPGGDQRLLGGHPALPVVETSGGGLLEGVRHIVTNHPAAFISAPHLEPAARFTHGAALVYHLRVGEGELVLLADTSLFINLMQGAGDNARFEANLAAWLSSADRGGDGTHPVFLAAGEIPVVGAPEAAAEPGGAGLGGWLNAALGRLGEAAPDAIAVRFFAALLLAATLIFALTVFPGGGVRTPRPAFAARGAHEVERLAGQPGGPASPPAPEPKEGPPA